MSWIYFCHVARLSNPFALGCSYCLGDNNLHTYEACAATLYDEDNITKMNSPLRVCITFSVYILKLFGRVLVERWIDNAFFENLSCNIKPMHILVPKDFVVFFFSVRLKPWTNFKKMLTWHQCASFSLLSYGNVCNDLFCRIFRFYCISVLGQPRSTFSITISPIVYIPTNINIGACRILNNFFKKLRLNSCEHCRCCTREKIWNRMLKNFHLHYPVKSYLLVPSSVRKKDTRWYRYFIIKLL